MVKKTEKLPVTHICWLNDKIFVTRHNSASPLPSLHGKEKKEGSQYLNHQGSCQACLSAENFDQKERLANTHAVRKDWLLVTNIKITFYQDRKQSLSQTIKCKSVDRELKSVMSVQEDNFTISSPFLLTI